MAKKSETVLKEKIQKKLKNWIRPIWIEKIQQSTIRGTPDMIGCSPCDICGRGLFVALELKEERGTTDQLQDWKLMQIGNVGGCGLVVKSTADLVVLEDYLMRLPAELDSKTLKRLTDYVVEQTIKAKKL